MPDKEGSDDEKKSTKSVVNKRQKQMLNQEDYLPEEGYDIARDMGRVPKTKDKKDATTLPQSKREKIKGDTPMQKEFKKKYGKKATALDAVKQKYKGQIMDLKKEELDLTQVAEAFGGHIVEQQQQQDEREQNRKKYNEKEKEMKQQRRLEAEAEKKKFRTDLARSGNMKTAEMDKRFTGARYDEAPFGRTPRKYKKGKFAEIRQKLEVGHKDGLPTKQGVLSRLKGRISSIARRDLESTDKKIRQRGQKFSGGLGAKNVQAVLDKIGSQKIDTSGKSLGRTLKKYSDLTEPTIKSKVTGGKLPMPGGYDADGGRTGTPKQQKAYDAAVQRGKDKFFKQVGKRGSMGTGLHPTETDLQFKFDKAQLEVGGRVSPKMTQKQRDKVITDIAKSKTIDAKPLPKVYDAKASKELGTDVFRRKRTKISRDKTRAGKIIDTPTRRVKLVKSFVGDKEPKVSDLKVGKKELQKNLNQKRFARIRRGASIRARKGLRFIKRNPLTTAIGASFAKDTFFPPKIGLPPMPKGGTVGKRTAG